MEECPPTWFREHLLVRNEGLREKEGGGGGARGLTLIQKTKGGEERTGEHAERWKGEEGE